MSSTRPSPHGVVHKDGQRPAVDLVLVQILARASCAPAHEDRALNKESVSARVNDFWAIEDGQYMTAVWETQK